MRERKLCQKRECRRPLPPLAVEHEDSFCSTRCCKEAYGVYRPTVRELSRLARATVKDRTEADE